MGWIPFVVGSVSNGCLWLQGFGMCAISSYCFLRHVCIPFFICLIRVNRPWWDEWMIGWIDDETDGWNDASRRPLLYVMILFYFYLFFCKLNMVHHFMMQLCSKISSQSNKLTRSYDFFAQGLKRLICCSTLNPSISILMQSCFPFQ